MYVVVLESPFASNGDSLLRKSQLTLTSLRVGD